MNATLLLPVILMSAPPLRFERHEIDSFPAGYQVAVADVDGDGRPDVIALSTEANRVDWYENPTWKRRPVARVGRPIDLAVHDLDGDGKPEIALASGFYFDDSARGGEIQWLKPRASLDEPWEIHPIGADPVVHRLRWADLDGDGKKELVHAPIFGPGSKANVSPKPSHLWAFRVPADPSKDPWPVWKIDESLTVLHGLCVVSGSGGATTSPLARFGRGVGTERTPTNDRRDELLTASFEGVFRFSFKGGDPASPFLKERLSPGEKPADQKPGTARGTSEVAVGRLGPDRPFLAGIEPWHGAKVVVYLPEAAGLRRIVLDETLSEGHVLVVADFDGDGLLDPAVYGPTKGWTILFSGSGYAPQTDTFSGATAAAVGP